MTTFLPPTPTTTHPLLQPHHPHHHHHPPSTSPIGGEKVHFNFASVHMRLCVRTRVCGVVLCGVWALRWP